MDISTLIGTIVCMVMMYLSVVMGGGALKSFYDLPSILCVFIGGFGATMICFPLKMMFSMPVVMLKCLLNKPPKYGDVIKQIVKLAETARRDGMLALESQLGEITNPFIKTGIQLAVDGTPPETIEAILRTEMDACGSRHKDGKNLLDQYGKFCPAYGMIGTLLGLVLMLGNMSDPSAIGGGMAVALLTTLYGAVVSNVFMLPFGEKLNLLNKLELVGMEIVVRGIMSIQAGETPRVVEQKLNCFLPPKQRVSAKAA